MISVQSNNKQTRLCIRSHQTSHNKGPCQSMYQHRRTHILPTNKARKRSALAYFSNLRRASLQLLGMVCGHLRLADSSAPDAVNMVDNGDAEVPVSYFSFPFCRRCSLWVGVHVSSTNELFCIGPQCTLCGRTLCL